MSSRPTKHPKIVARSAMMAVMNPMPTREIMKHNQPPKIVGGGIKENST